MTLIEELQATVRRAAQFNSYVEEAPVCILWPDAERLFEPLLGELQARMPELFILGQYAPDQRHGPAIWLRYMLDGGRIETPSTPIFYLPGVSRSQLRPEENCPFVLAPLCELIFRGKAWTHENGKDWTPTSLLLTFRIEVHGDNATRDALQGALPQVVKLPIDEIKGQSPLSASVLHDLLNPDPVEALLSWMTDPKAWKAAHTAEEWTAFRETCKSKYKFNPEKDGELQAAELLGARQDAWRIVWRTFKRAPQRFAGVIELLGQARPKHDDLFFEKSSWPQINAEEEAKLRQSLHTLLDMTALEARNKIIELEALHGERRKWVWCELGKAPLAQSLEHLHRLATLSAQPLNGTTPQQVAEAWTQGGWQCDAALLDALACAQETADWDAVKVAARSLYKDWLHDSATHFGECVAKTSLNAVAANHNNASATKNASTTKSASTASHETGAGVCYLFADGLRFDVAQKLSMELESTGLTSRCEWTFGPLPGVTPTAKPAAAPLPPALFTGGANLEARFVDGRKVTADSLRGELKKAGFAILMGGETGDPKSGPAWTECGAFDSIGHGFGAELAKRLREEIKNMASRIRSLLGAGWQEVRVVTDHGWMLLPGKLEKAHLHEHLTEVRKGRCARLKAGSPSDFQTVPWHWDSSISIAIAPGARCFEEGKEYEHGGLSVQECVLPLLTVRSAPVATSSLRIGSSVWKGYRCVVTVASSDAVFPEGYKIDLRTKAVDSTSSLCDGGKAVTKESVTLMIGDEHRGVAAHVVVLDGSGDVVDKLTTAVPDE